MKKTILFLILIVSTASAQRYDVLWGNLKDLKGISSYNVTFDYSKMAIHGYESEEDFVKEKVAKRRNDPEKAALFEHDWYGNRKKIYEPRFIEYFNTHFANGEVKVVQDSTAQYTMDISTTWLSVTDLALVANLQRSRRSLPFSRQRIRRIKSFI